MDGLMPLADAQDLDSIGQIFNDLFGFRSVANPIEAPPPIPGQDFSCCAAAAHPFVQGVMYFAYHFPALALGAARTELGTSPREAVRHVLRHGDREDPTEIRNLPENVGQAVRNPLAYLRYARAHAGKLEKTTRMW